MADIKPIVYTISQLGAKGVRIFTKDTRVAAGDKDITVTAKNVANMMTVISEILKDEGFSVLFKSD